MIITYTLTHTHVHLFTGTCFLGTVSFGYKGGIGSASRQFEIGAQKYTLGVLVQSNYGGELTIAGGMDAFLLLLLMWFFSSHCV